MDTIGDKHLDPNQNASAIRIKNLEEQPWFIRNLVYHMVFKLLLSHKVVGLGVWGIGWMWVIGGGGGGGLNFIKEIP